MTPEITAKLERIDRMNERLRQAREDAEWLEAQTGVAATAYAEADETDYLSKDELRAIVRGYRAGYAAASIGVEETASASQVEKPRAEVAPVAKPTPVARYENPAPANAPSPAPTPAPAEPVYIQQSGRAKRTEQQPTCGNPDWVKWPDPSGYGVPPAGLDKDDAIAYRMRDGVVLLTDYPKQLEWRHFGNRSDIVEYRLLTVDEMSAMDPWVEWVGGQCPVGPTVSVQLRMHDNGHNDAVIAGLQRWEHESPLHADYDANITAYRVVIP
jgi:hypothetical protein